MNPNKLNPGDEDHNPENHLHHWHNDMANDLHNDDALWFWAAKAGQEFMEWRGRGVIDPVVLPLFLRLSDTGTMAYKTSLDVSELL